jgi:hypothetical protein
MARFRDCGKARNRFTKLDLKDPGQAECNTGKML